MKKWIQGAVKHPGALHKQLGVPEGKNIPHSKLVSASKSTDKKEAARARLALELLSFHKK